MKPLILHVITTHPLHYALNPTKIIGIMREDVCNSKFPYSIIIQTEDYGEIRLNVISKPSRDKSFENFIKEGANCLN